MADANDGPRPFDVRTIRDLVRLMSQHDLGEIELREGDRRICLRRGLAAGAPVTVSAAPAALPAAAAPAAAPAPADRAADKPARNLIEIKSPTVGTFYAQKDPGSPPFVSVGTRVSPTTVVCIIEAMKVFNEIPAECAGTIVEVCAQNKDSVEYNTVLFRVDPGQ